MGGGSGPLRRFTEAAAMREEILTAPARELSLAAARLGGAQDGRLVRLLRRYPADGPVRPMPELEAARLEALMAAELHAAFLTPEILADALEDPDWLIGAVRLLWPEAGEAQITRAFQVAEAVVTADFAEVRAILGITTES